MSLADYFSRDPNKRAKFIFNLIAPIYGKADSSLVKSYNKSIQVVDDKVNISGMSVLDIGTGTGAWAAMFLGKGASNVKGIDFSRKMLKESKEKHPEIDFGFGNAEDLKDIPDNSYDIVTASFVIHGVKQDRRKKIVSEMKRVSKRHIVIHDFVGNTPFGIRVLEFLEKSDYKNFKVNFCNELKSLFSNMSKVRLNHGSGIYFAEK